MFPHVRQQGHAALSATWVIQWLQTVTVCVCARWPVRVSVFVMCTDIVNMLTYVGTLCALQYKRIHVSSDEQHSQMIRLCFCNTVSFCLRPASYGWTQRHLYPHPPSSLKVYLVFLIARGWLTELSSQSGRSVKPKSVLTQLCRSKKTKTKITAMDRTCVNWMSCTFVTAGE